MIRVTAPLPDRPLVEIVSERAADLSELDCAELLHHYCGHGALLLRGFAYDLAAFRALCRSLCPTAAINESPGRVTVAQSHDVQSVNLGEDAFPLHPELSREPWKPDTAFFACLAPPAAGSGGETTVCDGVALVRALAPAVRHSLAVRRLVYMMPTWPGLFDFWLGTAQPDARLLAEPPASCPYNFVALPNGAIMRSFSRPALHQPMFTAEPAFGNFLLFARYHARRRDFPLLDDLTPVPDAWMEAVRAAAEPLTYAHGWRQGDILILDNTRFMHGRRAIADPGSRRIVTYFGYLADAPLNPEEPVDPVWRRRDFVPPRNPAMAQR